MMLAFSSLSFRLFLRNGSEDFRELMLFLVSHTARVLPNDIAPSSLSFFFSPAEATFPSGYCSPPLSFL